MTMPPSYTRALLAARMNASRNGRDTYIVEVAGRWTMAAGQPHRMPYVKVHADGRAVKHERAVGDPMKKRTPSKNIEWTRVPSNATVEMKGHMYIVTLPDGTRAVPYWGGNDAAQAQRFLDARVRASGKRRVKSTRRDPHVTPRRAAVLRGALGAGRKVSNRAKGKLEVHEFLRDAPSELFAYYKGDARVGEAIVNWMGDKLGTITKRGKESRPFGGKVVSIQMKAINGATYSGRCNLSSGNYCKLRKMSEGRRR